MSSDTIQTSFDIYNEKAVELIENNSSLLPDYNVDKTADLEYNEQQINDTVESAIINGESIDKIAENLSDRLESINESSAVRTARTATISALNSGTLESFYEAQEMGINIKKKWVATLDDRTRPSHQEIDGEIQELDDEFSNGLQYPGDPDGDPSEVYNCRCTLVAYLPDYDDEKEEVERWSRDTETGEREYTISKTYSEWLNSKQKISAYVSSSSESRIEDRNTSRGKSSAIVHFDVDLNSRQEKLLEELPEEDSRVTVKKSEVKMSDLAALTAKSGVEFAMFTKGGERLIARGTGTRVNITVSEAKKMAAEGYKWSGHTHPGAGVNVLQASDGDLEILKAFGQKQSVIYNSLGEYWTFETND